MPRTIPLDEKSTPRRGRPRPAKQIGIKLDGDMYHKIEELAERDDRPVSSMVRRILKVALEDPTLWNVLD